MKYDLWASWDSTTQTQDLRCLWRCRMCFCSSEQLDCPLEDIPAARPQTHLIRHTIRLYKEQTRAVFIENPMHIPNRCVYAAPVQLCDPKHQQDLKCPDAWIMDVRQTAGALHMKFIEILFLQRPIDRHAVFIPQKTKIRPWKESCIADASFIAPYIWT